MIRGLMGVCYGYARVSSQDQDCAIQEAALKAAGCNLVRSEKRSGRSMAGRDELALLLDFIREGDTLVVTRVDRLARSLVDLERVVDLLKSKGAFLRATEQPIDTSSPSYSPAG
jgi:DNA invertase Pin-like site-specific DNA recombinase